MQFIFNSVNPEICFLSFLICLSLPLSNIHCLFSSPVVCLSSCLPPVFFISFHQFGLVAGRLTDLQVLLISCLERGKKTHTHTLYSRGCLVVSTVLNSCRRAWATSLIKHGRKWRAINTLYRSALSAFLKWRVASRRGSRPTSIAASWQSLTLYCSIGKSWLQLGRESEDIRKIEHQDKAAGGAQSYWKKQIELVSPTGKKIDWWRQVAIESYPVHWKWVKTALNIKVQKLCSRFLWKMHTMRLAWLVRLSSLEELSEWEIRVEEQSRKVKMVGKRTCGFAQLQNILFLLKNQNNTLELRPRNENRVTGCRNHWLTSNSI